MTKSRITEYPKYLELLKEACAGMNYNNSNIDNNGEKRLIEELANYDNEGVVFDIGANVGEYSILLRENMPNRTIYAFEPSKITFEELKKRMYKTNVNCLNIGFGDETKESQLFYDEEKSGLASVYKRDLGSLGVEMSKTEIIKLDTLDRFCERCSIEKVFFMKIDVEGNEYNVLKGSKRMLHESRISHIQFEFGGCNIDSRVYFRDFWNLLNDLYDFYRILPDGLWKIEKYTELLEIFALQNFFLKLKR